MTSKVDPERNLVDVFEDHLNAEMILQTIVNAPRDVRGVLASIRDENVFHAVTPAEAKPPLPSL